MRRLNEPSHLDLCCLTVSLSTLHINVFPNDSLLKKKKKKKADYECRLKYGAERVKGMNILSEEITLARGVCLVCIEVYFKRKTHYTLFPF